MLQTSTVGTNSSLEVSSINASHGGSYKCIINNTAGSELLSTDVFISPYFIEQLPAITRAAVGENVTLDCNAESYPSPTFHWEKNNDQGSYTTLTGETSRYLELTSVTVDVIGDYRCVVSTLGNTVTSNITTLYGMSSIHFILCPCLFAYCTYLIIISHEKCDSF